MYTGPSSLCSTPFGITGFGTSIHGSDFSGAYGAQRLSASLDSAQSRIRHRACPRRYVLNAFRHHWIRHPHPFSRLPLSQAVLNAFRHHWIRHLRLRSVKVGMPRCSTPFGITGFGTRFFGIDRSNFVLCSTPFGITGFGTLVTPRRGSSTGGAQRLSASLDSARANAPDASTAAESAQRLSASLDSAHLTRSSSSASIPTVLNAFRHHWIRHSTFFGPTPPPLRCAQRLSASLDSARVRSRPTSSATAGAQRLSASLDSAPITHSARIWSRKCAQRLSASLDSAQQSHPTPTGVTVCSTPFGITGFGTGVAAEAGPPQVDVLNAFRHHWIRHSGCWGHHRAEQRVLNAFRHHWIRHIECECKGGGWHTCSTPFGITGFGTAGVRPVARPGQVLNAFRHHWIRHHVYAVYRLAWVVVLNAFRHHWIRHSGKRLASPNRSATCSTPFGITGFGTRSERRRRRVQSWETTYRSAQRLSASLDSALRMRQAANS